MTIEQTKRIHDIIHSKASKLDRIIMVQNLIDEISNQEFEAGKAWARNGDID